MNYEPYSLPYLSVYMDDVMLTGTDKAGDARSVE